VDDWLSFEYSGTAGERCDAAVTLLLRSVPEFSQVSRARVQALIDEGGVLCDGKEVSANWKNLRPGMRVQVDMALVRRLLRPPAPEELTPCDMPLSFLHVDDHLAVVDKPAGISVHPSPTEEGPTLCSALVHHLRRLSDAGGADRPGIVHRLDKETSGLLVVARDNPAHVQLSQQFADRLVDKEYLALCIDAPCPPAGTVNLPINRHPVHRQKMYAGARRAGRGREALTEYRVARQWGPLALTQVAIHTGRTHQIRVHLLTVGASILNDEKYGSGRNASLRAFLKSGADRSARRVWREAWPEPEARGELLAVLTGYPGIFLHAWRLAFNHPASGQRLSFELSPPPVWDAVRELCGA
jgi:23S rRNA pseudouridine1911/1915/1917 synthase